MSSERTEELLPPTTLNSHYSHHRYAKDFTASPLSDAAHAHMCVCVVYTADGGMATALYQGSPGPVRPSPPGEWAGRDWNNIELF